MKFRPWRSVSLLTLTCSQICFIRTQTPCLSQNFIRDHSFDYWNDSFNQLSIKKKKKEKKVFIKGLVPRFNSHYYFCHYFYTDQGFKSVSLFFKKINSVYLLELRNFISVFLRNLFYVFRNNLLTFLSKRRNSDSKNFLSIYTPSNKTIRLY